MTLSEIEKIIKKSAGTSPKETTPDSCPANEECANCFVSLPEPNDPVHRKISNARVCKECSDEISHFMIYGIDGKGWKYEEFWQVEQKYPRVFEQGFYQKMGTPKL